MSTFIAQLKQQSGDPRSIEQITWDLGQQAEAGGRKDVFDQNPDFFEEYLALKREMRPGLWQEFKDSVASATDSAQATGYGALALGADAVGLDRAKKWALENARENEEEASLYRPSVESYSNIRTPGDVLSYLSYGAGQMVPGAAESVAMAAGGAVIGGAMGSEVPGAGTAAGAVIGGLEGIIEKEAIKRLIKQGVKEMTKDAIVAETRKMATELGAAGLSKMARKLAGSEVGGYLGTLAASEQQSIGGLYSRLANDPATSENAMSTSLVGGGLAGLVGALPEGYIAKQFFGRAASQAEVNAAKNYLGRFLDELPKTVTLGGASGGAQELVTVASEKYARGEAPGSFTDVDWERIANAGLLGAEAGGLMAPLSAAMQAGPRKFNETDEATRPAGTPPEATPAQPAGVGLSPDVAATTAAIDAAIRRASAVTDTDAGLFSAGAERVVSPVDEYLFDRREATAPERMALPGESLPLPDERTAPFYDLPPPDSAEYPAAYRAAVEAGRAEDQANLRRSPAGLDLLRADLAEQQPIALQAEPTRIPEPARVEPPVRTIPRIAEVPVEVSSPKIEPAKAQFSTVPELKPTETIAGAKQYRDFTADDIPTAERADEAFELTGKNKSGMTAAVVILDRSTGQVYQRGIYKAKGERMVEMAQSRAGQEGSQGRRGVVDLDTPTEGRRWSELERENSSDGLPRFEILGHVTFDEPQKTASLNLGTAEAFQQHPEFERLHKAFYDNAAVPERSGGRRAASAGKTALNLEMAVGLADDVEQVTRRTQKPIDLGDAKLRDQPPTIRTISNATQLEEYVRARIHQAADLLTKRKVDAVEIKSRLLQTAETLYRGVGKMPEAQSRAKAAELVRATANLTQRHPSSYRIPEHRISALFSEGVKAVREAGGDVALFEQNAKSEFEAVRQAYGLAATDADGQTLIGLGLRAAQPIDTDAVVKLYHEIGHQFMKTAGLAEEVQQRYHDAIDRMHWSEQRWLNNPLSTDPRLLATADPATLSPQQAEVLRSLSSADLERFRKTAPETLLVEQAAEHLGQLGVDKGAARGMIQQVIRAAKDVMYRAALAFWRAIKGAPEVNDRLVRAYVENRFLQFISRDFAQSRTAIASMRDFFGLPATPRERVNFYHSLDGDDMRVSRLDVATGRLEPADFVAHDADQLAVKLRNALVMAEQGSRDVDLTVRSAVESFTPTTKANIEVAHVNNLAETINELYKDTEIRPLLGPQMATADFAQGYLGVRPKQMPDARKAAVATEYTGKTDPITRQPIHLNPDIQIADLPKGADGSSAADKALRYSIETHHALKAKVVRDLNRTLENIDRLSKRRDISAPEKAELDRLNERAPILKKLKARLDDRAGRLESKLEGAQMWNAYPGAEYVVPETADATPDAIEKSKRALPNNLVFNAASKDRFYGDLMKLRRWLNNEDNKKHGALYGKLAEMERKLATVPTNESYTANTFKLLKSYHVSLLDVMRRIGTPVAKNASRALYNFQAAVTIRHADATILGERWSRAYNDFRKAMHFSGSDDAFQTSVYDPMMRVFESFDDGERDTVKKATEILNRNYQIGIKTDAQRAAFSHFVSQTLEAQRFDAKAFEELGLKVKDDELGMFRRLSRIGYMNGRRSMNRNLAGLYHEMNPGWAGGSEHPFFTKAGEVYSNRQVFAEQVAKLFPDSVKREFVEPLVRNNVQHFDAPLASGEVVHRKASLTNVHKAWADSKGDITSFIETLHRLEGGEAGKEADTAQSVMNTFNRYFGTIAQGIQDMERAKQAGAETLPRQMMDARLAEDWPAEWVSYSLYDKGSNLSLLHQMALNHAFGRDGFGENGEFTQNVNAIRRELIDLDSKLNRHMLRDGITDKKELAKKFDSPDQYIIATQAKDHLESLGHLADKMRLVSKTSGVGLADFKALHSLLGLNAQMILQNPRSGLVQIFDTLAPLWKQKFGVESLKQISTALLYTGNDMTGFKLNGLLSKLGVSMEYQSEMARNLIDAGIKDTANYLTLADNLSDEGTGNLLAQPAGYENAMNKAARNLSRFVNKTRAGLDSDPMEILTTIASKFTGQDPKALIRPRGDDALATKTRLLAPFNKISMSAANGQTAGLARSFQDLVLRGLKLIDSMGMTPQDQRAFVAKLASGSTELTPEQLGYKRRWLVLNDRPMWDYLKDSVGSKMNERSVENLIATAWERRQANPRQFEVITRQQLGRIATISDAELSLKTSALSAPIDGITNPFLRMMSPFLMWPYMASLRAVGSLRDASGRLTALSAMDGLTAITMGVVPATMAASMLMDQYDDKVAGKKQNIRNITGSAAIPGVGLFTQDPLATMERLARYGGFGLAGDLVNQTFNVDDSRGGGISLDNRVLAVAQLRQFTQLVSNIYNQEAATYQTAYRPLLNLIGLNGVLQYEQIAGNAIGLDNKETQVNRRISVGNYLRAEGRALKLDVKTAAQSGSTPTPITPYIQQLELAALSGDTALFREAYAKAIRRAQEAGKEDPNRYVRQAFSDRHPLRRIFRTSPTEGEYRNLLGRLDEDGRVAVSQAINSYNRYLDALGAKPFHGLPGGAAKPQKPAMTLEQARALAAQESYGSLLSP